MSTSTQLPEQLAETIKKETAGEIIRWSGQPDPGLTFRATMPIWFMAIPWSALTFTLFGAMLLSALSGPPPDRVIGPGERTAMAAALIFLSAFVAVGLGMLLAPFWAWHRARQTAYVITDKRLITVTTGRTTTIRSFGPSELLGFERKERKNGRGTLNITTGFRTDSDGDRVTTNEQLTGIPDVARVERILRELQERAGR